MKFVSQQSLLASLVVVIATTVNTASGLPALVSYGNPPPANLLPLGRCEGDCDKDSHCAEGLYCYQRKSKESVPGCSGGSSDTSGKDYCVPGGRKDATGLPALVSYGNSPSASKFPLGRCSGGCDEDSHCAEGLYCYERDSMESVPGCSGGSSDTSAINYCVPGGRNDAISGLPALVNYGSSPSASKFPLGRCSGDCDEDSDCAEGLFCYQRDLTESVPGCSGGSSGDASGYDYCVPGARSIAGTSTPFDYSLPPTGPSKTKCALINVAMDESSSMRGDQAFMSETALPRMAKALYSATYGYSEVFVCSGGFGGSSTSGDVNVYRHMGCTTMDSNGNYKNNAVTDWVDSSRDGGGTEDGWAGMKRAMNDVYDTIEGKNLISTCGRIDKNLILVTDEDRDDTSSNLTAEGVKAYVEEKGYVLNAIVNIKIDESENNLGMKIEASETGSLIFRYDSSIDGYTNFTKSGLYTEYVWEFRTTHTDYSALIVGTRGAIWNINALRAGGKLSQAFADAFVAVKVEEISTGCGSRCEIIGSNGDPHFKTWKNEHFEFHGQCDMILAKDSLFANGIGLDVQIRTKMVRFWSYIHTAAIRVGDDILEIQGSPDNEDRDTHYWFNFQFQADTTTIGGFPLTIGSNGGHKRFFEIDLSSEFPGQKIVISAYREFVAVEFKGSTAESFGNTVGMLGDYKSGKTLARDGAREIQDFNELGNEWQLLPSDDMLFHDKAEPQFPKRCIVPEDPRGQRRRRLDESTISVEQAEAACATLKDPLTVKDCVYDILATQDLDMVGAF